LCRGRSLQQLTKSLLQIEITVINSNVSDCSDGGGRGVTVIARETATKRDNSFININVYDCLREGSVIAGSLLQREITPSPPSQREQLLQPGSLLQREITLS
jgi:hypothetical protein